MTSTAASTVHLQHHRLRLALHTLMPDPRGARSLRQARSQTHPLLLLHGLGERSPAYLPDDYADWPGTVHALDFTGHGASDLSRGGGYSCEFLMADADIALAHLGPCTVAGRGLGAYVALLLAGARPGLVRGAILRDGPGMAGGGPAPQSPHIPVVDAGAPAPPDPYALADLATDIRPPAYAANFALLASQQSEQASPILVCASEHPEWLTAVMSLLTLEPVTLQAALQQCSAHASPPSAPVARSAESGA